VTRRRFPYLVALLVVAAALALRGALDPWLGPRVPYITAFGSVIVAAWIGGTGPAIAAAALGWLGSEWFFIEPRGAIVYRGADQIVEALAYVFSTGLIAALGGAMQNARRRADANEQRFRGFMQYSPNGVFIKDEAGRYVFMNRVGESLAGTTRWEGITDAELLPAEVAAQITAHDREVMAADAPLRFDLTLRAPEGTRTLRSLKFPLRDPEGRRYLAAVTMDVSAEQEAQRQVQALADALPAVVTLCSRDLRFLYINRLGAKWLRRTPQEVIGKPMAEIIGTQALAQIRPYIDRVLAGEEVSYEREVEYLAAGRRWASVHFAPVGDGWVAVITDIHERKRMEVALREADRRKDQFIATLAHELRNPLAPIRTAVAILGRESSEQDRAWSRGVIERQVGHMSRLVEDLLDVARVTSGKLLLRRQRITLESALGAAIEASRPLMDDAGHRFTTRLPSAPVVLDADPTRLAQALSNLLNNAAKYTPPGGAIELSASLEGGEVEIAVTDNGMGFPPELAHQIFEPFTQWAPADRPAAGLGIGLSLVKGVVALHDGSVTAKTDGPGKGSRFAVRLPVAADSESGAGPAAVADPVAPAGMRVLVADDNRDAADTLCRMLALYGYEVRAAYDGASALEVNEAFRPHVAVLDIGMPTRSGYDVARELRARRGRDVRLIALTGWGSDEDVKRAREAGFDQHLTKPVEPAVLGRLLARGSR
jgi:PAS domain S-box-containing protein